jgi:uncharacterized protein
MNNRLIAAAGRGQTHTVLSFIREGADINATDASGRTAVLAAVHGRHADTARALIDLGADVNKQDQSRDNPLLHAGAEGLLDMVRLLLEAIILSDGGAAHQRIVKLLLDHGADSRIADKDGVTPLEHAAKRRYREIEKLLAEAIARVGKAERPSR